MRKRLLLLAIAGLSLAACSNPSDTGCCDSSSEVVRTDASDMETRVSEVEETSGVDTWLELTEVRDEPVSCKELCKDVECGYVDDGQGGSCSCWKPRSGQCCCNPTTYMCECIADCMDLETGEPYECGDNGIGGVCGTCPYPLGECIDHKCVCAADCDGKDCGSDGCGGTCGACETDYACNHQTGVCAIACDPQATVTFGGNFVQKVNYMDVGVGGHAGQALDLDNDPETCAPEVDCEDGINNELSWVLDMLASFVDATVELENALAEGSLILLAETYNYATDGSEFSVKFYLAEPAGALEDCDIQTAKCDYLVAPTSFDPFSCAPIILFQNAHMDGNTLVAGGPDNQFAITIPISDTAVITVTTYMAQLRATVVGEGDAMRWTGGLIGGAIPKAKIMEAVDQLPPGVVDGQPATIDTIKGVLNMFIHNDVDTDGDGELDAASFGIKFGTIAGSINGMVVLPSQNRIQPSGGSD